MSNPICAVPPVPSPHLSRGRPPWTGSLVDRIWVWPIYKSNFVGRLLPLGGQASREAQVLLAVGRVRIPYPQGTPRLAEQPLVSAYVLWIWANPRAGVEPLEWILVTSVATKTVLEIRESELVCVAAAHPKSPVTTSQSKTSSRSRETQIEPQYGKAASNGEVLRRVGNRARRISLERALSIEMLHAPFPSTFSLREQQSVWGSTSSPIAEGS